jgi:hypothetical protein
MVMKMTDHMTAKIMGHRRNILRYSRLLATHLTDLEREYIHKRIAVEQSKLEDLELQVNSARFFPRHRTILQTRLEMSAPGPEAVRP